MESMCLRKVMPNIGVANLSRRSQAVGRDVSVRLTTRVARRIHSRAGRCAGSRQGGRWWVYREFEYFCQMFATRI